MKQLLLVACLLLASCAAAAADLSPAAARLSECLNAAAAAHGVPASLLVVLLKVEGGTLGKVSQNTNDTVDIGPMQVNVIWVPKLAARWKTTREAAHTALRDNLCANLEAGAWILRQALDTSGGDFWRAVAEVFTTPTTALLIYALLVAAAVVHELGHATACRYGGAEPGEIGVGVYLVFPAFYTDVTDSYRLGRAGRLRTDLGGLYFNVLTVLALALLYVATGSGLLLLLAAIAVQLIANSIMGFIDAR